MRPVTLVIALGGLGWLQPRALAVDRPDGVTESQVMIPMRDGVRLSAYLYFPKGTGPWPVLYQQLYLTTQSTGFRRQALKFAAAGYVVAQENFRGTQLSEGVFSGYRALGWGEHRDGYDTVEWLARQAWSDGKVGTFGPSQAGYAQNFLAVAQPPHLICQYIVDGGLSLFYGSQRLGGISRPLRFAETMLPAARHPDEARRFLQTQFEHPDYDDYWREEDCSLHLAAMNVPAVEVASWYDFMSPGGIQTFIGRQHSGGPGAQGRQKLVIGPWIHGGNDKMATKVGDLSYPANSHYDLDADMIRWFDHFLKGRPNGAERAPAVRYYVMGASGEAGAPGNYWRETDDWPVAAQDQSYFLRERDSLSLQGPEPQEGSTDFLSDPLHPAPMPGRFYPAAKDDRSFERDPNVRTFTSEALAEPVEWTGKVRAELYVSSSARDTDFIARVCDVYPDGRSILLIDSVRRARYRDGFEHAELLVPGRIYRIAFDVGWISQIFNRGHRIRVDLSGTAADFYEPNPNTGEPFTIEASSQKMVAHDTLYHSRRYASRLIAPLVSP